jgi:glucuronate isomerase
VQSFAKGMSFKPEWEKSRVEPLRLHPDRALPSEPALRARAREIYAATRDLPLVCMHGHVDAAALAGDVPFEDPAQLLVVPDHYVVRMLTSQGSTLEDLGVTRRDGGAVEADPRMIWRRFASQWHLFRGTPSRYWLEHELVEILGIDLQPCAENADAIYDTIVERLADAAFRPRALLDRFNIELLATTDSAVSDLGHHQRLRADGLGDRVVPTFRPDALVHVDASGWAENVSRLGELAGIDAGDYPGFVDALRSRRQAFVEAGALASDHGHLSADTTLLGQGEATRIFFDALRGKVDAAAAQAFAGHMLHVMAELACEDGLVMQIHPGVLRDYDAQVHEEFGPDKGFDIPVGVEFTQALQPVLARFGRDPRFRMILFTTDETTYSRELAPLAGAYSAVRLGAPWWFLDSADGMRRFRELVTETAGFYNTSGFVDDTRAFLSIPARHDLSRRVDAGYLARLVAEHRLEQDEAVATAIDLAYNLPRQSYQRATALTPR